MLDNLPDDQRVFAAQTIDEARALGADAAVLVVGSRAAGYARPTSDLDLFIVAGRASLNPAQRVEYDERGEVFVRGDGWHAHYSILDERDLRRRLATWREPMSWLIFRSAILHDPVGRAAALKADFAEMPREVQAERLRWWMVTFREAFVWMRDDPTGRLLAVSRCVEALCRICCLADGVPPPYPKWLSAEADRTRLGERLRGTLDAVLAGAANLAPLPEGVDFRTLSPFAELRALRDGGLARELNAIGWDAPWIDDPFAWVWVLFRGEA